MTFEHYGRVPLMLDLDRTYIQKIDHKPHGFWISVKGEDDWPNWVVRENFGSIDYMSEIVLKEEANIVKLENPDEILEFHEKYGKSLGYDEYSYKYPDWNKVAEEYDGIIIAPYQWSLRLKIDMLWYYSWDVASGCIWNLNAIESVTPGIVTVKREELTDV